MKYRMPLLSLVLMLLLSTLTAQTIQLTSGANDVRLLSSDDSGLAMQTRLNQLTATPVDTQRGAYTLLSADGWAWSVENGLPRLPQMRKIISVPLGATVSATATVNAQTTVSLTDLGYAAPVFPAQPSVSKSAAPEDVRMVVNNAAYAMNDWQGNPGVQVEELGIMRGLRLFVVTVRPVAVNTVTNQLQVWTDVLVNVQFTGGDMAATNDLRARTWSPAFEGDYSRSVFNYRPLQSRDQIARFPQKMIVISDRMFEDQLQPFFEWKRAGGIQIIEAYTDVIGTSTTAIQGYIQDIWDSATADDPAPSYVLFVGDVAQIPAYSGTTGSHVTDLHYVRLEGNDFMPEMHYGRFSANNTTELQPQIDKTLLYEQYTMSDPSYLAEVVMIAGVDSSHGSTWANGQINYGTSLYFNEDHGITSHTYLYPESGNNSAQIVANVSDGVGYANYTAHGSEDSWYSPSFTIPNINSLQNAGKYPLVVGNCCLTNHFNTTTCFGEAWLRAENKGAIGYIGGTNSTYWDEDYWWGVGAGSVTANPTYAATGLGSYDCMFHDHNEAAADWYTTAGGMIMAGNLAVVEGNGSINYYWEIYSLMGDPSLIPYMGVPSENDADWPEQIFIGLTEVTISAEPYSCVALSMDGELYGTGIVDDSGEVTLTIPPFTVPGDAQLVITAQNRIPIITTIPVIPNEGVYLVMDDPVITDGDDDVPAFGDTMSVSISVENVGSDGAVDANAALSTESDYITLIDAAEEIGAIAGETVLQLDDIFSFQLAEDVPDGLEIPLTVTITTEDDQGETQQWTLNASITAHAPSFIVGAFSLNDTAGNGNGLIDPGETVTVAVPVSNTGSMASSNATVRLSCNNPYVTIQNAEQEIGEVESGSNAEATFAVTLSDDVPYSDVVALGFGITAGAYYGLANNMRTLPAQIEDFEDGLTVMDWAFSGNADWALDTSNLHEGAYSLKSGAIGDGESCSAEFTFNVVGTGIMTFWRQTSCEGNSDYLRMYIDDNLKGQWSGTGIWQQISVALTDTGEHTFRWTYEKNASGNAGSDCVWIDYICFPGGTPDPQPLIGLSDDAIDFGTVTAGETGTAEVTVFNYGNLALVGAIETPEGFTAILPDERDTYTLALSPMESMTFTLVFAPTSNADYSGQVIFASNDPQASELPLAVIATGYNSQSDHGVIATTTALAGNYPNPFNPVTTVRFSLAEQSKVTVDVYNVLGQRVARLVNESLAAGEHSAVWHGVDDTGRNVGSGIYFCRMTAGRYTSVKKMILLK